MATQTVSSDLVWLLVKKNSRYLIKRGGNSSASVSFTSEPFNMYNVNSFKYSGLANKKAVGVEAAGEGLQVVLTTKKTRKQNQPKDAVHRQVLKRDFRRMAKTIVNQVQENRYRPDLTKAAFARLSAVHKSLRVAKAGGKKAKSSKKLATRK